MMTQDCSQKTIRRFSPDSSRLPASVPGSFHPETQQELRTLLLPQVQDWWQFQEPGDRITSFVSAAMKSEGEDLRIEEISPLNKLLEKRNFLIRGA
jgi:hypothetical protein